MFGLICMELLFTAGKSDYSDMDAPLMDLDEDEVELRLNLTAPPSQV